MLPLSIPRIDGDFLQTYSSVGIEKFDFVKVPILIGTVSDEGVSWISGGLQRRGDLGDYLQGTNNLIPPDTVLSSLFPILYVLFNFYSRTYLGRANHIPFLGPPWNLPRLVVDRLLSFYPAPATGKHETLSPPIKSITDADLFDRADQILSDLEMTAARRLMCDAFARSSSCYSYRWDAVATLASKNPREGVMHSAEIGPVMQNVEGFGYFYNNPFNHRGDGYYKLTRASGLMWAGFITQLNPNAAFEGQEPWPKYAVDNPRSIVFNETGPHWIEADTLRKEATDYINTIQHSVLRK